MQRLHDEDLAGYVLKHEPQDWEKLIILCNFVVMTRPGYENKGLASIVPASFADQFTFDRERNGFIGPTGYTIYFREVTFLDISSRNIRQRVRDGRSITYLVPEAVRHFILKNALYRTTQT